MSRKMMLIIFTLVSISALLLSLVFAGATVAYRVNYKGKTIATVLNTAQFENAAVLVARSVNLSESKTHEIVEWPVFTSTLVLAGEINSSDEVAEAIIENTDEIVRATALSVNGEIVACTADDGIYALLEQSRNRFNTIAEGVVSYFADEVTLTESYHLSEELTDMADIKAIVEALPVVSTLTVSCDTAIPYKNITRENPNMQRGDSRVITKGVNGVMRKSEIITYNNGVETSRTVTDSTVVTPAVDRVVEMGTAKRVVSGQKTVAGLTFPLPSGAWQVSAYYGDGRNHQAVDLRAPAGTSIYAAMSGTVVSAGWDGNYGKAIVIDHGNGIKTRYAHEKDIFVKCGDTVSAGEVIGTVGKTGNATGNHLHFEIIVNGTRINPEASLGL